MSIAFRAADLRSPDRTFIVSTWSSSFKTAHAAGLIHTDDWATIMHAQIGKILDRADARAVIAFERDDPDFLYGWIAGDTAERPAVVWYVYVKEAYRRAGYDGERRVGDGYARQLFAAFGIDPHSRFTYACKTPIVSRLAEKIPRARWNPLVARYPKQAQQKETPWPR